MKELDQFTVERLQAFIDKPLDNGFTRNEQIALAKTALAAKTAEPIGKVSLSDFRSEGTREAKVVCLHDQADWDNFTDGTLLFLTPPVNSPETPDGWVMVPKEPTGAMLSAAKEWTGLTETAKVLYREMLAAAPKPEK
jgi:hypothetical protein